MFLEELATTCDVSKYSQIDGFVQDCTNSSALAMNLLQPCTKPSKY